jgi:glycosyltransferase involved in cell wall biosynthesis
MAGSNIATVLTAEELVEIYNSCRIFLHPSRLEGWGLPAAEAMVWWLRRGRRRITRGR